MTDTKDQWVAAETVLSDVDGEAGRLIIKGSDLESLAGKRSYEDVVALLWKDVVKPAPLDRSALQKQLGAARVRQFERLAPHLDRLAKADTAKVMAYLLAVPFDMEDANSPIDLLATCALAAALATRHTLGVQSIPPDPQAGHAADVLRMTRGDAGSQKEIDALDTYLVTAIDHGLNASTFAARVVASTRATLQASLVAGFAALTGPLHGGAPGPVLDMLDAIAAAASAKAWIDHELAHHRRLMGFGHRIYRVRDPRADVLKAALKRLAPETDRVAFAESVESVALAALNTGTRAQRLDTNTEFYTALLLEALRIPRESFTPIFAAARAAGWIAHVYEQQSVGRLIRPLSKYVGEQPLQAA